MKKLENQLALSRISEKSSSIISVSPCNNNQKENKHYPIIQIR